MKLLRHGPVGQEKPGAVDRRGTLRDLSGHIADIGGAMLLPDSLDTLKDLDLERLPEIQSSPRPAPCRGGVGKFITIGLNYADHAAPAGVAVPHPPGLFPKATSRIRGPNDNVCHPRGAQHGPLK